MNIWQVFFNPPQNSWHRFMHSRRTSNPHWNVSCLLTGPQNQTWLTTWSVWGLANPQITRNVSYQVRNRKITVFWNLLNPTSSSDLGALTLLGKYPKWDPKNLGKSSKSHLSLQKRVSCWILGIFRFAQIREGWEHSSKNVANSQFTLLTWFLTHFQWHTIKSHNLGAELKFIDFWGPCYSQ